MKAHIHADDDDDGDDDDTYAPATARIHTTTHIHTDAHGNILRKGTYAHEQHEDVSGAHIDRTGDT